MKTARKVCCGCGLHPRINAPTPCYVFPLPRATTTKMITRSSLPPSRQSASIFALAGRTATPFATDDLNAEITGWQEAELNPLRCTPSQWREDRRQCGAVYFFFHNYVFFFVYVNFFTVMCFFCVNKCSQPYFTHTSAQLTKASRPGLSFASGEMWEILVLRTLRYFILTSFLLRSHSSPVTSYL